MFPFKQSRPFPLHTVDLLWSKTPFWTSVVTMALDVTFSYQFPAAAMPEGMRWHEVSTDPHMCEASTLAAKDSQAWEREEWDMTMILAFLGSKYPKEEDSHRQSHSSRDFLIALAGGGGEREREQSQFPDCPAFSAWPAAFVFPFSPAIREDGMPGGRNKSIGPVQVSELSGCLESSLPLLSFCLFSVPRLC